MDDVAFAVAEQLHLDVARLLDVLLQVNAAILEGALGFLTRGLESGQQRGFIAGHAHAAAAAARRRLDEYRKTHRTGQLERVLFLFNQPFAAGHDRHAGFLGEFARLILVAQSLHRLGRWADELDLAIAAHFSEMGVLRQKAVAGMNGLHIGGLRRADEARNLQIAFRRRGRADADFLIGQIEIRRTAIRLAVDGDRLDAHLLAGANDPQGDLSSIGDQNAMKHHKSP